ncbi:conjugal transfer protein TraR [Photobacterium sp. 1_MG-2023]|uniref:TraR/DksA family transcriptional regulator n=1 Tax=Photobacterium sp. 1_MG-2023 TaxID=3062646 RepID=UPI0026E1E5D3|nr:conjugal transfer protein TraR [Photobacterium sp. 1_MG-2023]MDO6705054.1 conjugal transfer protein TraR [Photobacterium sp. 1_MG-2023]
MNSEYLKQQCLRLEQEYQSLSASLYAALEKHRRQTQPEATTADCTINELLQFTTLSADPQLRQHAHRLEAIDAALCAIRLDLYGICTDCEEPIESEILAADPAQPRCRQCQSHSKYHHQR